MSALEFVVLSYFGIGISYAFWAAFGMERKRGGADLIPLLIVGTGTAIWWPIVMIDDVRTILKRARGG